MMLFGGNCENTQDGSLEAGKTVGGVFFLFFFLSSKGLGASEWLLTVMMTINCGCCEDSRRGKILY